MNKEQLMMKLIFWGRVLFIFGVIAIILGILSLVTSFINHSESALILAIIFSVACLVSSLIGLYLSYKLKQLAAQNK